MSYTSTVLDIGTYFLYSFSVLNNSKNPVDLNSNTTIEVSRPFYFFKSPLFMGNFITLKDDADLRIIGDFPSQPYSIAFWLKKSRVTSKIVDWGDESSGFSVFYDKSTNKTTVFLKNSTSIEFDMPDYCYLLVKVDNSVAKVFVDAEEIHSDAYSEPSGDIVFGSQGECSVGEPALISSNIDNNTIRMLYDIGSSNVEKVRVSLQSPVTFSDRIESILQTVWQAYGQITTKK